MREDTVKPGRLPAAILAVLVHLLFIGFLIFSVNWRSHPPPPVMADLWEALPPPPAKPVLKPQPAPKPKPEPVAEPQPPQPQPDIALKEKKRKERLEREQQAQLEQQKLAEAQQRKQQKQKQQQQQEAEQRKLAEQEKQQQEKQQQEKQQQEKQQQEKQQQEKQQDAKRKQEALRKLNVQQARDLMNKELASETSSLRRAQQASQLGAEQAKMEATYKERIRSKIASMLNLPENMVGNPKAVFAVTVLPSGEVGSVKLISSSGQPAYDTAVERAILKAVPLPLPPDKAVAARFHDLTLPIQPKQEN